MQELLRYARTAHPLSIKILNFSSSVTDNELMSSEWMKSAGCDRNKFNVSFMMSSMRNQWLCAYHTLAISFPYHFTSISGSLCSTSSSRWLSLLLQPKQIIMDASINFFFSISAEQCLACNRSKINISKKSEGN